MKRLRLVALFATALLAAPAFAEGAKTPGELPLEAFAQLPVMQEAELSPDGTHVAFFYPIKGRNHIIIQPIFNADQRKVIPPPGELEFRWINWANDERLIFSAMFSGVRFNTETTETRLGSIKRDGSDSQWIMRPATVKKSTGSNLGRSAQGVAPQIQDRIVSWLPEEPDHILVSVDDDFNTKYAVRKINVNNGDFTNVRGEMRGVQHWLADASNVVRLGWGYHQNEFTVMFLDNNGDWTNATRSDWWDRGWSVQGFTEDPMVVFVRGPGDNGSRVVAKMNIGDGSIIETVFSNGEMDVKGVRTDSFSRLPIGVNYVSHLPRTKYFDKDYDRLQRTAEKAFAGMAVHIVSLSANRKQLLVKVSSDTDPGVLYYWDRAAKSMDVLAELMPGLTPELLSAVKPVSYPARDKYSVPGYLTLPTGGGETNLPTIVLPHGGPGSRDDQSFFFITQFLASRGYAVFQPNFRGSTGYGYAHRRAGQHEWGGLMQDDVTDGANWLVETGVADPQRMCIVGWSYGGYAAAMGAVMTPDLFKCAASINGVMDIPRLVNDKAKYVGGSEWAEDVEREGVSLTDISPYHQAERIKIPMLLIQAKDDSNVHDEQGKVMAKKLSKLGKQVDYVTVDLGGHSMTNAPARKVILESLEKFLNDNIGT